ncbi:MAG: hemin ABC transporter substrate-binding protein, partial [Mesorhizobium sp.]
MVSFSRLAPVLSLAPVLRSAMGSAIGLSLAFAALQPAGATEGTAVFA